MDFHTLSPLFSHAGAAEWGMCAFADLELSTDQLEKAQVLCPTPAGVFIAAFPYWAGGQQPQGRADEGNDTVIVLCGQIECLFFHNGRLLKQHWTGREFPASPV